VSATFADSHPSLPDVLRETYADDARFRQAKAVLVPTGGARLLHRLQTLSGGRYMMLAMDKGHVDARTILESDASPHVAEHGALSFMANFHCLAALHLASATAPEGAATAAASASSGRSWPRPLCMRTEQSDGLVKVVMLAGGLARPLVRGAVREFRTGIVEGSPDDFAHLHRGVKAEVPKDSIVLALSTAILRLSACDPDVFFKFREPIISRSAPTASTPATQTDMGGDADAVLQRHFHMHSDKDVAFEIGRVYMSLRDYPKAFAAFRASQELCGRHRVTTHNMGLCMYFLKDFVAAEQLLLDALAENPDYESARIWLARAREAVATGGLTPQEIEVRRAAAVETENRLRMQAHREAQARLHAEEEGAYGADIADAAGVLYGEEQHEDGAMYDRDEDDDDALIDEDQDEDDEAYDEGEEDTDDGMEGPFTGEEPSGDEHRHRELEVEDDFEDDDDDDEEDEDDDE
jgi:tetratricopeptide (TPR) repeat protein